MLPSTSRRRRPFVSSRALRLAATALLGLAVVTCSDDHLNGPSGGTRGYFGFRPVTHLSAPPADFGIVIDSVHIRLTRPPSNIVVLDTTAFFPADSSDLKLALLVSLTHQSDTLDALIELKAGPNVVFRADQSVVIVSGPPGSSPLPVVNLAFVGPGTNVAHISIVPKDTAVALGDSIRYSATAVDSSSNPVTQFYTGWKSSDTTLAKMNATGLLRAPNHRGTLKVIGTTPTGIADTTTVYFVPVATALVKVSGNLQSDTAGRTAPVPIVVEAKAADSLGVAGVAVHFSALSGGAVTDSLVLTDSLGRASTPITLGTLAGPQKFLARVGALAPDTFTVTALAGAPAAIAIQGGNAQTDTTDLPLALPLAVTVTDAFGNAVTGAKVAWLKVAGGGTVGNDTTASDSIGVASVGYTLGALARTDTVSATLAGTSAKVTFTATAVAAVAANIVVANGGGQTDTVGKALPQPFVVFVSDARAHLVAGARVVWTAAHGAGSFVPDTSFTDSTGHAQTTYTVGTLAGTDSLVATLPCGCTATFTVTALAGAPAAITIQSGDAQGDTVSTALPLPLVVKAADAFGNAVSGATINWVRLAGGGTLSAPSAVTAATGLAQVTYTLGSTPRVDSIKATLGAGPASVTFTATTVPPAPAAIAILSGNAQTDTVTRALALPLVVHVTGSGGKPVAGTRVAFSLKTGTGTFGGPAVDTITTDTLGHAQVPFTLGVVAGVDSVLAKTVVGGFTATFAETAIPAAPSVIGVQSGNAQTDTIGLALPLPLAAKVTDSHANPVAGVKVLWTRVVGNGTVGSDSAFTNALGVAQTAYTLGGAPSVDSVHATIAGTGAFALFTATAVAPVPSAIAIVSGNAQTDTVGKLLALPLVVSVTGAGAKPVAGTKVAFSLKTGSGTFGALAVDTITTDTLGHAQVPFTLGTVAGTDSVLAKTVAGGFTVTFGETAVPGAPSAIAIVSGNAQSDTAKGTLPLPLIVKVTDAQNNLVTAAKVIWTVPSGAGTFAGVAVDTVATAANGQASVSFTLGTSAGTDTLLATIEGTAASVKFTAIATSGAASALTIVSGNLQTDTVGVALPAPLVVRVADGSNNPVANTKVYWTRTFGTGTVSADSNVTNALGQAQVTFTLATTAGTDSIKAALASGASVMFAGTGTPGAAATIVATGGTSQSGSTGTVLPNPLTVKVTDAHANAVPGRTVTWVVTAGGGTLAGVTATTDATGTSTVAQWTLGGTAGTNTATATLAGVSGSPVTFTAVSLPLGTTKTWTGSSGTAWATAGSWSPAGIPLSTDNVYIPSSAPAPSLTASASVGGLQLEAGATLTLNSGDTLAALGTILIPATAQVTGAGQLGLNGTTQLLSGTVANLVVSNSTQLAAATHVTGDVSIGGSGSLTVNGHALTVGGNVTLGGSGQLVMTGAADSVDVGGSFTAGGGSSGSNLTAGKLVLRGGFTQLPTFSDNFSAIGANLTIFAGSAPQTVSFGNPGPATSHFANVAFANPAGVTLSTDFTAVGEVTLTGNVNGTAHSAILGGGLTDATSSHWHVDTTSFVGGGAPSLPDSISGVVSFSNAGGFALSKAFKVNGALIIAGGSFAPSGHPLTVAGAAPLGALSVVGTGQLDMISLNDSVDVAGPFVAGGNGGSAFTGGKLVLRNSFAQLSTSANDFVANGIHRVIFAGTTPQVVSFANPGTSSFHDVTFANPAGVTLGSSVLVNGTATVAAGQVTGPVGAATLAHGLIDGGFGWHADTTYITAAGALFPDSMTGSLHVQGADTLVRPFKALGNLTVDGSGILVPHGNPLTVLGNFATAGSGRMQLLNALDSVDVQGTYTAGGGASNGDFATGTLVLRGNFAQLANSSADFAPSGTFRTVFAGSAVQTVAFANPGAATSHFTDVTFNSAGGVTLNTPMAVTGTATLLGGNVTGLAKAATIGGNLVDASNSRWHVDTTIFTGSPALPDSFSGSVHFQGATTLAKSLKILGALTVDGSGVLTVNGHALTVTSGLTTAGSGQLVMTSALDSVDVSGPYTASGLVSSSGDLTAGTLVLRGTFTQGAGSSNAFSASGTHRTIFAGSAAQAIFFANAAQALSHFQDVTFDNAAGITLSTPMAATGTATVQTGVVTGAGRSASLGATLIDAPSTGWQVDTTVFAGSPASFPDSISGVVHLQGVATLSKALKVKGSLVAEGSAQLQPNGHPLVVTGALTLTGGPRFIMSNAVDSVDVGGAFSAGSSVSSAGDLTQGVLVLRGGLAQSNSTASFAPSGSHRVIFAGSTPQTLSFASPGVSGFNLVQFADAGGVAASTDFSVASTATVLSGTVTGPGHGVTLQGALQDVGGNGWHVDTTTFTATPGAIPDSIHGVVHFQAPVTMVKAFRVAGALFLDGSNGVLTPNGFPLTVVGALHLTGSGQLRMVAAGDSVDVGGFSTATTVSGAGLDTTGILVVRGGFHQLSGGIATAFAPSGSHRTRLVTPNVDSVSFFNPSLTAGSHFNDLEFTAGGNTMILGSDVEATGAITKAPGAAPTLKGAGTLLRAMGLDVSGMVLDSVRLMKSGTAQVVRFDSVTFQHQDSTADQFTLVEGGSASPQTFNGIVFSNPVKFGTGHYIVATDSVENGQLVRINMNRSTPLYGGSFTQIISPFEAAAVNWSGLAFATAPLGGITGIPLAPVRVALVGPLGDTLTNVADSVTALISTNPVGGTLTGVTSVPLVNGIATFNSLTLNGVGNGYVLMFGANGFQPITSTPLNIDIQIPAGINAIWRGTTDSLWTTASNWQSDTVPDSSKNVFIPLGMPHNPYLGTSGFVHVNRLVLAGGATFKADTFATVQVDSSLDNGGSITGGGTVTLAKSGTVRGIFNTLAVTGNFSVVPGSILLANRDLTVSGVTARLDLNGTNTSTNGSLTVTSGALLVMTHAADTLNVAGDATFSGGNELGSLTAGRILLQGNFAQYGSSQTGASPTAFAATAGNVVELLRGSGVQTVHFANPDTLASHLGSLVVSGSDSVVFDTLAIALGNVSVTGTNAAVQSHDTLAVAGNLSTAAGSRLWLNGLGVAGGLNVAGAYHVHNTGFIGAGQAIPALPYVNVRVTGSAALGANVTADSLTVGGAVLAAQLDLNGRHLTLTGNAIVDTSGTLLMTSGADTLTVGGNLTVQGHDSTGKLTAGLIDIAGNFAQPTSSGAFVPTGTHTVRFNGGSHLVTFDNTGVFAIGYGLSSFNHLDVVGGATVEVRSNASVTGNLTVTGSTLVDTTSALIGEFLRPNDIQVNGNVTADATSTLHLYALGVNGVLSAPNLSGQYNVGKTTFGGTSQSVPVLPYQSVEVDGTATAGAALAMSGLTIGNGSTPGAVFDPAGFPVTMPGQLTVAAGGLLQMTNAADSVDVGGYVSFAGANSNGHLTAGTLVLRSGFIQNAGGNDSAFFATGTHRTVFTGGGSPLLGISYAGTRFNRLVVRDTVTIQSGTLPLLVGDSLLLQGGALSDFGTSRVTALGPVIGDSTAWLFVDTLEVYDALTIPLDTNYGATVTRFFGSNQAIPSNLSYLNVDILGTVHPVARFEAQDTLNILAGSLDANGQVVIADSAFSTGGTGTLTMTDPADSVLVFGPATFNGGSTAGLLTAGVFQTPIFHQMSGTSTASFAASGSHRLEIVQNQTCCSGEQIDFGTSGAAASHPQNLLITGNSTVSLTGGLFVGDTLFYDVGDGIVNGAGAKVIVTGPFVNAAFNNFDVDTLELRDSSGVLNPSFSSNWGPQVTVFAGTNQAIRDSISYRGVEITGSAHVNFHASTDAIVVNGGNLTINNGNIGTNGDFTTENGGTLTMDSVNSRLFVGGNATFGGGSTAGTLNAGEIQVGGNFFELATSSATDFAPLGTKVTLNGASQQQVHFNQPSNSYFRSLDVFNSGGINALGVVKVTNNFTSNQPISGDTLAVFGTMADTNTQSSTQIVLHALLLAGPVVTNPEFFYQVDRTHFLNTNPIPQLPYTDLVINAPISFVPNGLSVNNLYVAGPGTPLYQGSSGSASLTLPPGTFLSADTLDVEGGSFTVGGGNVDLAGNLQTALGGTVVMNQPSDSIFVGANAIFNGNSTAGQMTDGTLTIAGSLLQSGDPQSFAPSGNHLTEFVGPNPGVGASHLIQFANPATSAFANLREDSPDTLILGNGQANVAGNLTITHAIFLPGLVIRSGAGNGVLSFGGSNIASATFDTVTAQFNDSLGFTAFDSVAFNAPTDNFTQFAAFGAAGNTVTITNPFFTVIGSGNGIYVAATNTSGSGTFTVEAAQSNVSQTEFNAHTLGDALLTIIQWLLPL